ncbi:MAG: hypothetical protein PQJ49_10495 [Sphaerochaetaceae bacterium]|nr:hypothetical protein [Sphaerochaetaceae bacterium]
MAQSTNKKEGKDMAHKGGIYKVLRTTTYQGRTIMAGQKIKLIDSNCKNRNLKKIEEFDIDAGFNEQVSGVMKDYIQEDGAVLSRNSNSQ